MKIFRDPTLAATTVMVVCLAVLTGLGWQLRSNPASGTGPGEAVAAVATWRSHLGPVLRLSAVSDPAVREIAAAMADQAQAQAVAHDGTPLGAVWDDAAANATELASVPTDDRDSLTRAVSAVGASADALAAAVVDGTYHPAVGGGSLPVGEPHVRGDSPDLPGRPDPAMPDRPSVPAPAPRRPLLGPGAPSAPVTRPGLPESPISPPSLPDPEELSP